MKRLDLGMILGALTSSAVAIVISGCGSSGGDTYTTNEAPLPEQTPTNGTNIVVSAENESEAGLSYTNVSNNSILVSCGDDCNLTVNEATKVEDEGEDDNETEEE